MLLAIPLMLVPFALYNLVLAGVIGGGGVAALAAPVFSVRLMSGADWTMSIGELIVVCALAALFFEILKSARTGTAAIVDHGLSTLLFVGFLVEFLLVAGAATGIFFILTLAAFIDVVAGFAVSIRSARRDVAIGL